jgi:hypothetical protein
MAYWRIDRGKGLVGICPFYWSIFAYSGQMLEIVNRLNVNPNPKHAIQEIFIE